MIKEKTQEKVHTFPARSVPCYCHPFPSFWNEGTCFISLLSQSTPAWMIPHRIVGGFNLCCVTAWLCADTLTGFLAMSCCFHPIPSSATTMGKWASLVILAAAPSSTDGLHILKCENNEGKINVAWLWRSTHLYLFQQRKECSQGHKEEEFR